MTGQVEVPLTQGFVAVVDADDYERVMTAGTWQARPSARSAYAQRTIYFPGGRRTLGLHTFLTGWARVDHRNGDGLDNRRKNLREATAKQNSANRQLNLNSATGFKGVGLDRGRWRARIQVDGRLQHLGSFDTPEEAAHAYDAAALELFGEFARPNFTGAIK